MTYIKLTLQSSNEKDITVENIGSMYDLSEAFNAISLRQTCIVFILEHFDKLSLKPE